MGKLVVVEQRPDGVGHDELIGFFAVTHRKRVVLIVLDEPDDLELQLLSVGRFDNEDIAQLEQAVVTCRFVVNVIVGMAVFGLAVR